ncbi:MAG: DNA ligase, partial [Planctomycetota bacterium]|nr:DNA ligase [Planctomycetota bacterium]
PYARRSMAASLPPFIPPMLAQLGRRAFDSDEHLFEPKWDGFRALVFVEQDRVRARTRRDRDLVPRFPEVASAGALPPGTALDAELIVMVDGAPSFEAMLRREQARGGIRVNELAHKLPAALVVFDLLYVGYASLEARPLHERRERLVELLEGVEDPRLVLSEGVVGAGKALFEQAQELGLEGVVAKRLDSRYLSGQRSDHWTKVKVRRYLHCLVLGWQRDDSGGLKSLILASDEGDGGLRCVGKVGTGWSERLRAELKDRLEAIAVEAPLIEAGVAGEWVAPELFCTVSFLEFTGQGTLRAPAFEGLVENG